jgi:uncharacterized repeat protein (TIGR01451 family)
MPTRHPLSNLTSRSFQPRRQDLLLLLSTLVGLLALTGLIYRVGAAQAASTQPASPGKLALVSPAGSIQAQAQITAQNPISPLDIVIAFDVSGSMEDQTICHDCWVRTSYNPTWPTNGYFNPLPYNPTLATAGTDNQSIPQSGLCTVYPPQPFITNTFKYLTLEAELYSRNTTPWDLGVRTPGQGFWALQRGSRGSDPNPLGENSNQDNQTGDPTQQSSNVCRPNVVGAGATGIDCTVGVAGNAGDNVCSSADGGIARDCSAYIAARPMVTYSQLPGSIPNLVGAAYNADCFSGSALSGTCWSGNPFSSQVPELQVGPSDVPWVEYDFTPTWTQTTTSIWIRAIGGGMESYTWAGRSPDQIQPDANGGGTANNVTPWRKVVYWQMDNGTINQRKDNINTDYSNSPTDDNSRYFQMHEPTWDWRVNRAVNADWRWIKLGSTTTVSGIQYTLKLYQGSASYRVDKIVFTNDPTGSTPEAGTTGVSSIPAALRRQYDASGVALSTLAAIDSGDAMGPPASLGSATREACNACNPAYGYVVNPNECTCRRRGNETGYGTGQYCTVMLSPPPFTSANMLQAQLETGLYSGLQPLRSAQEAVKTFASRLDPQFDQLGLVPFTGGADNTSAQGDASRRSKLQCLSWATKRFGNTGRCYDPSFGPPITYTNILSAVEKQWPQSSTNIAGGIKEGLEELGIPGFATNSNCSATINDGSACDRQGAVRRILILMTDGPPNENPGTCAPDGIRPDLWEGLIGTEDPDFECPAYFASIAAANNVTIYTIGIGPGPNGDLLTELATGIDPRGDQPDVQMFNAQCGQYFSATKPTDLEGIFEAILDHARHCTPNSPALVLTKTDTPDPVLAGDRLTYTLALTNYGAITATGVVITDVLDSNVSFASASDGGIHNAGVVTWNVGGMPPNQTIIRTLAVTVSNLSNSSILTNTAWVTSSEGAGDSATATTTVAGLEQIWTLTYVVDQGGTLPVHLENHLNIVGPYDIYLEDSIQIDGVNAYKICEGINTSPLTNDGDFNCPISSLIPPGVYYLESVLLDSLYVVAIAPQQVEVGIPSLIPPGSVTLSGPTTGFTNTIYTFTATTSPITTTLPLTYFWQASGQAPLTHTGGLSNSTNFIWSIAGPQVITVTASNGGGSVMDTHNITLGLCADPLSEKSFENPPLTKWVLGGGEGVTTAPGSAHTGNTRLLAPTFAGFFSQPFFYQPFTMPTSILSATLRFKLSLFKNIDNLTDGNDPNDHFYAVVTTGPSLASTHVSNPVEVANGVMDTPSYSPLDWRAVNVLLLPASGINLNDYLGQTLYLHFYNHSNANCTPPSTNCHATKFYFDDVSLELCSADTPALNLPEPPPGEPITAGDIFTYTLIVANNGSVDATGVVMTDTLDNQTGFVSASDSGQHQAGLVTWQIGALPFGQTISRTLAVSVGNVVSGTLLHNTVLVSSTEGISSSRIIITAVANGTAPPATSSYLPIILKQK